MNTPEVIYKIIIFFFSNIWVYIGLVILILTIKGDLSKAIKGTKDFVKNVIIRYREREKGINSFKSHKKMINSE